jgi:hypothetical protein
LKVGANVEVRQSDGQYLNGVILKLTDATTYTVGKSQYSNAYMIAVAPLMMFINYILKQYFSF